MGSSISVKSSSSVVFFFVINTKYRFPTRYISCRIQSTFSVQQSRRFFVRLLGRRTRGLCPKYSEYQNMDNTSDVGVGKR